MVAIHNPANLPMKVAQIAVSSTLLSVMKYDATLGKMVDATANILCNIEMKDNTQINNCQLFVEHEVSPG